MGHGGTVFPASASDATAFTVDEVALDAPTADDALVDVPADGSAAGVPLQPATPALTNAHKLVLRDSGWRSLPHKCEWLEAHSETSALSIASRMSAARVGIEELERFGEGTT